MSLLDVAKPTNLGPGGLKKLYLCLRSEVADIPAAVGNVVSSAITNISGKKFIEVYFTPDTGKLTSNSVGETDGKSIESVIEYILPGLSEEQILEIDKMLNEQVIALTETNNGKLRILGDLDRGCLLDKSEGTSGGTMAERSQTTINLKYSSAKSPLFYSAAVPLTPAA
jgi:hypothetical protein